MKGDRAWLLWTHVWMSVGYVGFHAATGREHILSTQGRLGALAMGVCGVVGFIAVFMKATGRGRLREGMLERWEVLFRSGRGGGSFAATAALAGMALALAGWIGDVRDEMRYGVMEGIRNGVFLMVFAYIMRFRLRWGVATVVAWALMDLAVFGVAGGGARVVAQANGVVMMAVGLATSLVMLESLAGIDDSIGQEAGRS